jgi:hypothetical protein
VRGPPGKQRIYVETAAGGSYVGVGAVDDAVQKRAEERRDGEASAVVKVGQGGAAARALPLGESLSRGGLEAAAPATGE